MSKRFKYTVDGKEVSFEYYNIIKIMRNKCFKNKGCKKCDLTDLCNGYDGIPLSAELKIE